MNRNRLVLCCLCFSFALLPALSGCYKTPAPPPYTPPVVLTASVEAKDVQLYGISRGTTAASDSVDVVARVEGYLEASYFVESGIVQKGDPLFLIEQRQYEDELDQAAALLESSKAKENLAKANLDRAKQLVDQNTIPVEEYQTNLAAWQEAVAETKRAVANLSLARTRLIYTQIYAPITGMISRKYVTEGNLVGAAGEKTRLATINKMDPIYVYFDVTDVAFNDMLRLVDESTRGDRKPADSSSSLIGSLYHPVRYQDAGTTPAASPAADQAAPPAEPVPPQDSSSLPATPPAVPQETAALTEAAKKELPEMGMIENQETIPLLERGRDHRGVGLDFEIALSDSTTNEERKYEFQGRIDYVDNTIGRDVGKITVRGAIPNANYRIFPGQICHVRVPLKLQENAILIREDALMSDLTEKYVIVIDEKNIARKRTVRLGDMADSAHRIVLAGLQPGEKYVVQGTQKAKIGKEVKPMPFQEKSEETFRQ